MQIRLGRDRPGHQRTQPRVGRRVRERVQHRQSADAFPQIGARGLPGVGGGDVDDVVGDLERHADGPAVPAQRRGLILRAPGEHPGVAGAGVDQRRRLLVQHAQVMGDRVLAGRRPDGFPGLPGHQLGERLGDDPHRVRAEPGDQPGGVREQEIAGQDRDGVVPPGVRRLGPAAHVRLVHHVVVVQRRKMDQLDDGGGDDHLFGLGMRTDTGRHQGEQRPEPLAAGVHQMRRGLGHEVELADQFALEQILHPDQAGGHPGRQARVGELDAGEDGRGVHTAEPMSAGRHQHRFATGDDSTPNTCGPARHAATARHAAASRQHRQRDGQPVQRRPGEQAQPERHEDGQGDHDDRQHAWHHDERSSGATGLDRGGRTGRPTPAAPPPTRPGRRQPTVTRSGPGTDRPVRRST